MTKAPRIEGVKETYKSTWDVTPRLRTVLVAEVRISVDLCPHMEIRWSNCRDPSILDVLNILSFRVSES